MNVPAKLGRLLSSLQERGPVGRSGGEWRTRCPAHADTGPSLYVRFMPDSRNTLVDCKAGCDPEDIVSQLGLSMSDLFHDDDEEVEIDDNLALEFDPVAATSGAAARESVVNAGGHWFVDGTRCSRLESRGVFTACWSFSPSRIATARIYAGAA